jgi:propanol-preferring alcohol dehydrogenase
MRVIAIDTGSEKKSLCSELGAEKWIDFKTEKDIVKAVQAATPDGLGPHGAIVAASSAGAYEQAMGKLLYQGTR